MMSAAFQAAIRNAIRFAVRSCRICLRGMGGRVMRRISLNETKLHNLWILNDERHLSGRIG